MQLDKQLLKAEVRPGVLEDIRMQADEETRLLLLNSKVHQLWHLHADTRRRHLLLHYPSSVPTD